MKMFFGIITLVTYTRQNSDKNKKYVSDRVFWECSPLLQPGYDVSVSREQPGRRTTTCKIIFGHEVKEL